jgi:hypothetical protein
MSAGGGAVGFFDSGDRLSDGVWRTTGRESIGTPGCDFAVARLQPKHALLWGHQI